MQQYLPTGCSSVLSNRRLIIARLNNIDSSPIGWIGLPTSSDEPLQVVIDVNMRHSRLSLLDGDRHDATYRCKRYPRLTRLNPSTRGVVSL